MATIKTEGKVHINEDLEQVIYMTENEDTPLTSSLNRTKVESTKHEWLIEELTPASSANAWVEGAPYQDTASTAPVRVDNYTQIFMKGVSVTNTMNAVNTVGGKEMAHQILNRGKELKRDIEKTVISAQVKNNGSGGVPRLLQGVEAFITTTDTDLASAALAESDFRDTMQAIFEEGGKLKKVFVSPTKKSTISQTFNGASQKQQDATKKTVYGVTDIYVGDFGTVDIIPSLYVTGTTVLFVDPDRWALGVLRKMEAKDEPFAGDAVVKSLRTELTLIAKSEKGNGKITNAA